MTARMMEKSENRKGSCVLQMFLNQLKELFEGEVLAEEDVEGYGRAVWEEGAEGAPDDATGGGTVMLWC